MDHDAQSQQVFCFVRTLCIALTLFDTDRDQLEPSRAFIMVRTSTQKRDDLYDDQFDFPTFCRWVPCFVTSQTQIAGRSLGGTRHFMPGILPHNFSGILTPLVRVLYCTLECVTCPRILHRVSRCYLISVDSVINTQLLSNSHYTINISSAKEGKESLLRLCTLYPSILCLTGSVRPIIRLHHRLVIILIVRMPCK